VFILKYMLHRLSINKKAGHQQRLLSATSSRPSTSRCLLAIRRQLCDFLCPIPSPASR